MEGIEYFCSVLLKWYTDTVPVKHWKTESNQPDLSTQNIDANILKL